MFMTRSLLYLFAVSSVLQKRTPTPTPTTNPTDTNTTHTYPPVVEEVCGETVENTYFDVKYLLGGGEKRVKETFISCSPLETEARQSTQREIFTVEAPQVCVGGGGGVFVSRRFLFLARLSSLALVCAASRLSYFRAFVCAACRSACCGRCHPTMLLWRSWRLGLYSACVDNSCCGGSCALAVSLASVVSCT